MASIRLSLIVSCMKNFGFAGECQTTLFGSPQNKNIFFLEKRKTEQVACYFFPQVREIAFFEMIY